MPRRALWLTNQAFWVQNALYGHERRPKPPVIAPRTPSCAQNAELHPGTPAPRHSGTPAPRHPGKSRERLSRRTDAGVTASQHGPTRDSEQAEWSMMASKVDSSRR